MLLLSAGIVWICNILKFLFRFTINKIVDP
jgi:hypothetical protein